MRALKMDGMETVLMGLTELKMAHLVCIKSPTLKPLIDAISFAWFEISKFSQACSLSCLH
ncbi:MAG TPA: hypothetical protein VGJ72_13700 [Polaromonas sp.]